MEVKIIGKLYFIGCGPGDRKLLTIKGEECIKISDIVFYFPLYEENFKDLLKSKELYSYFNFTFDEIKNKIENTLNKAKNIAFLVPGDLSVFSPFSCFLNYFEEHIEIIPGIGTFNYLAAKIKKILNPPDNVYSITILGPKILHEKVGDFNFEDFISEKSTLIIYMNDMEIEKLQDKLLRIYPPDTAIYIGVNLSTENEKIFAGTLGNIEKKLAGNSLKQEKLTTIIVGNIEKLPLNIKWWDNKVKEHSL